MTKVTVKEMVLVKKFCKGYYFKVNYLTCFMVGVVSPKKILKFCLEFRDQFELKDHEWSHYIAYIEAGEIKF